MKFSIIIPVKNINDYIIESMEHMQRLLHKDFEIIILPDYNEKITYPKTIIIPTGSVGPALKRDIGAKKAKGEFLAFLDDDAYPRENWLKNAEKNFADANIAAVGGPAVTPINESIKRKISGLIFSCPITSGGAGTYRYVPGKRRYVDDFPSVNFIVRKSVFEKLNGFDTNFWPGEDTKLCLDIVHKLNMKIIYDPTVLVYHHRREVYKDHLKQVKSYAIHRGFFAKKYPQTSFRIGYFMPSIFVLGLLLGWLFSFVHIFFFYFYIATVLLYIIMALGDSLRHKSLAHYVFIGVILTHLAYGIFFMQGILSQKLKQ
ncbi:MAG: glycosyltransferase [archaeon]